MIWNLQKWLFTTVYTTNGAFARVGTFRFADAFPANRLFDKSCSKGNILYYTKHKVEFYMQFLPSNAANKKNTWGQGFGKRWPKREKTFSASNSSYKLKYSYLRSKIAEKTWMYLTTISWTVAVEGKSNKTLKNVTNIQTHFLSGESSGLCDKCFPTS